MDLDDVHSRQIVAGTLIAFKPRKTNRKLRSDDICFQCGCAGELIQCDDCPRVFHLECISNLDNIPEGAWRCPWHSCYSCGNEAETALDPGYYCVHCPTSYCSVCAANSSGHDSVSLRIFATLFPPDVNTFSSLRRSGFTLQNPSSLLFVCPKCTSNTEGAVCEMYRPVNGSADLKKVPFKISTAMMHKKLLRSFSALPSKYSHQNKSIDFMKIRGSYAETPVDSSVVCLNEIESDLNDKLLVQIKEQNEIDMRKTETCTDVSTLALSEAQQARSNSISSDTTAVVTTNQSSGDVDECAQPVSPTEISRQVSEAVNPTVSTDTTSMSSSSRTNMLDHPAVRKFFSSPNAGSLCKMRAKGWTFLYPFPISESFQAPNSQLAHKLVGCRCRRYFTGYGKSDGVLVAHLAGKRNEGLTLLHCVHDDGDEEDLDEEEAATAASDFNTDCKTKSESNKMRLARKHQLDLEVQALVRAQGETQVVRAATTLSRAAVLAEACKRAPVECIGYYMTAAIPSSVDDISLTTTPSKTPDTPSAQTAVVLKRFSNAREAATLMMRSVADSSAPAELTSDTGVSVSVPQTQSEGGGASVGSGKKDSTTDGGSEVAERVRLSAWWKEILRCCRGQRAYFLGLKWQFAFPRLVGLLPGSTDDHQHNPDRTDSQNRETLSDEGDAVNRAGAVRGADDCDSSIAASLQRRIRTRVPSVASQTSEHDAFSLLRAECSQSQVLTIVKCTVLSEQGVYPAM